MNTDGEAQAAINGLHDQEHNGRRLTVNEAEAPASPARAVAAATAAVAVVAAAVVVVMVAAVVAAIEPRPIPR